MQSFDNQEIIISTQEAGQRLDKILASRYHDERSRSYFQYLIRNDLVTVNGKPVKKHVRLEEGDVVMIEFILTPQMDVQPENIPLDILFEDKHILVINKEAGMVVHPAPGNWTGTFVNALLFHCQELASDPATIRPGIVHRLDKDTSGVLIAAKAPSIQQKLIDQFAGREVKKRYLAICIGNPGNHTIEASIARHPVRRKEMHIPAEGGRASVSHIRTLSTDGKLSVVQIDPVTGRTHQIRVHLQHHRTPILGDPTYGSASLNKKYGVNRQLLHAYRLQIIHPITGANLVFTAPIPADIQSFIEKIEGK